MKVSTGTITRSIILALALINQILTVSGHSPIPIEDEAVTELIATTATIAAALVAWWKNNSFTSAAIQADEVMKDMKE